MIAENSSVRKEYFKCRVHNDKMWDFLTRPQQDPRDLSVYEDEIEYDELVALMSV